LNNFKSKRFLFFIFFIFKKIIFGKKQESTGRVDSDKKEKR